MHLHFKCSAAFKSENKTGPVDAHFDAQGMRLTLKLPAPGPTVGEFYDVEINGPGIPEDAHGEEHIHHRQRREAEAAAARQPRTEPAGTIGAGAGAGTTGAGDGAPGEATGTAGTAAGGADKEPKGIH